MGGARLALIVANDSYEDPGLRRLEAPAHDAQALADVLGDPGVGAFDVRVLQNGTAQDVRVAVEEFFVDRSAEDLLLLHFSCHGVKNADGELFLALRDTRPKLLAATGLSADFVNRQMAASRAQRIALFLDCCYGGAFPRGMVVRASGEAQVKDAFTGQEELAGGRGRVVVTASNSMQYSFEGDKLSEHNERPSLFTGALVDALATGEADKDGDGWVGMNELFSFVEKKVSSLSPNQTPQMWTFGSTGDIRVARSRVRRIVAAPLEPRVVEAMADELPAVRYGLVDLFRERLASDDLGRALAAWNQLTRLQQDDSNKVSDAADAAVASAALHVTPDSLDLELDESGAASGELSFSGVPLVLAFTAATDVPWLKVEYADPKLRILASDPGAADAAATLTLTSPTGVSTVPVRVRRQVRGGAEDDAYAGLYVPDSPSATDTPPADEIAVQDSATVEGDAPTDGATPDALPEIGTPPDTVPPTPPRPRWRRRLPWGAAAAAVVVVVVAVLLSSRGGGGDGGGGNSDGGGVSLPQGPGLADDVLVWVDQTDQNNWVIDFGFPGGPVSRLRHDLGFSAEWPVLLPDRRTVLYLAVSGEDPSDMSHTSLRVVGSNDSGDRALFSKSDACPNPGRPSLNPDGDQIALVCFDQSGKRLNGVRILDLQGNLVPPVLDKEAAASAPTWSQDGSTIVYRVQNGVTVGNKPGQSLWAIAADGSAAPARLTTDPSIDSGPVISPDGKWIVYVKATAGHLDGDLYLIQIGSNDQGQPTIESVGRMQESDKGAVDRDPTWSLDSSQIVYSSDGVLMTVAPDVTARPEPLFGSASTHLGMPAWARR